MSEPKSASWWQTLPGTLTGAAAVITAIAGLLALLAQQGMLGRKPASSDPPPAAAVAGTPAASSAAGGAGSSTNATAPLEARAGHYIFRVLDAKTEPYATGADGKPTSLALRLNIRVTDVMGVSDYVDRSTIRLAVDGAELIPTNSINVAVYDRQAVETEALFVIPADARRVELIVGRATDASARIPLEI